MSLRRKSGTLCQDILISNIGHDKSSVWHLSLSTFMDPQSCGFSDFKIFTSTDLCIIRSSYLYLHRSLSRNLCILWSLSLCTLRFLHPQILDAGVSTSMGPQIPEFLGLYIYGSSYHYIQASTVLCITTSMDPWILWSWDVCVHRSSDPSISTFVGPQISGSWNLYIHALTGPLHP